MPFGLFSISPLDKEITSKDRREWLEQTSLEDILTSMRQRREDDATQYDEIIE